MASNSKRRTNADLSAILEGLCEADVQFILVGGLAAVVQGAPITTLDVDIVHDRSSENVSKLFTFLKSIDAIYRRPDDKILAPSEEVFSESGHVLLSTRLGPLDVLAFIEQGKTYDDLIEHTIEIGFRGHRIQVLDFKTLIELKKASKDPRDQQRIPLFEETLRQIEEERSTDHDTDIQED